jgi:hypothetical protein
LVSAQKAVEIEAIDAGGLRYIVNGLVSPSRERSKSVCA